MTGGAAGSFAQAASIVALWDFETDETTTDSAGSNTLNRVGDPGPTTVTGKIGDGAGGFSASDYFETAGHVGPSGTSSVTYFGWFKTSSQIDTPSYIIAHGENLAMGQIMMLTVEDGQFWIRTSNGRIASYGADDDYNNEDWHSFVVVVPPTADLSDVVLYIDGSSVSRTTISNDGPIDLASTAKTFIGVPDSGSTITWTGDLDQIGIADTAWTLADAQDFHFSGDGRATSYLLGS
jgi:hypothetical protein